MNEGLLNMTMADGSRHFASLPEARGWDALRVHVGRLPGVTLGEFVTDHITEAWIDFAFEGHDFTINNQFGEYWFFVRRPDCPDSILLRVIEHCTPFVASHSFLTRVADSTRHAIASYRAHDANSKNRNA